MGMPGRVVPWEISWRAVLGFEASFSCSGVSWDVVVGFPFKVSFEAAMGVGSRIAEGAMVAFGLLEVDVLCFRAWQKTLSCRGQFC